VVSGGERIPKRKPDHTTVVRFELQDTERALLESFVTVWQVGKLAESFDKLTSFENIYAAATLYEIITKTEILAGTPNDIVEIYDAVKGRFVDVDDEGNPIESTRGTWEGFWDVDLQSDWARFMGWLRQGPEWAGGEDENG